MLWNTSPSDRPPPWNGPRWAPQPSLRSLRHPPLSLLQFSQQEEKRQKAERLQQQQKHENQMRDMAAQCESNMSELQQLQVPAFCCPPLPQIPPRQSAQGQRLC